MAHQNSKNSAYDNSLDQDQFRIDMTRQVPANWVDEDVRRFACDRCRGQKLRCERNRTSLNTPLKSTPCRRCIKARVRCTTSAQPRPGRNSDEINPRAQRRQSTKQSRGSAFDVHIDHRTANDDEDDDEADREYEMEDCPDHQPPMQDTTMTRTNKTMPNPANLNSVSGHKSGAPSTQELQNKSTTGLSSNLLQQSQRMPPCSQSTRPDKDGLLAQNSRVNSNLEQPQHGLVGMPNHSPLPATDTNFLENFNFMVQDDFDDTDGVIWPIGSWHSNSLDLENDFAAGAMQSQHSGSRDSNNGGVGVSLANIVQPTTTTDPYVATEDQPFTDPSSNSQQEENWNVRLTSQLTQLTSALFKDLAVGDDSDETTEQQANDSGNRDSPMSKLLWNLERFLCILGEVPSGRRESVQSTDDNVDPGLTTRGRERHGFERRVPTGGINRCPVASNTTQLLECGLASLTTMMAMMAAYTSVLQSYERVFGGLHRSLVQAGRCDSASLSPLLPLFQLDSVKFATQNSLQVHVALEVSLQMLNQIENRISSILATYKTNCGGMKECLLGLLQSLIHSPGNESSSASGMIRDTINGVRKMYVSGDSFV